MNFNEISKKTNNNVTRTITHITNSKKNKGKGKDDIKEKGITMTYVMNLSKKLNKGIEKDKKHSIKYVITAQTITNNVFTLKGRNDILPKYETMHEYLQGRVSEETKFEDFYAITISMVTTKLE